MKLGWLVSALIGGLVAWSGVFGGASGWARAEPPKDRPTGSEIIRFRRVYAPADRLKDWPRDQVRYVPMEKTEFERLVGAAQAEELIADVEVIWLDNTIHDVPLQRPHRLAEEIRRFVQERI